MYFVVCCRFTRFAYFALTDDVASTRAGPPRTGRGVCYGNSLRLRTGGSVHDDKAETGRGLRISQPGYQHTLGEQMYN